MKQYIFSRFLTKKRAYDSTSDFRFENLKLLLSICFVCSLTFLVIATANAQTATAKRGNETSLQLTCIPPTGLNYTNNTAFYCTGIPITPNIPSFSGSGAVSYNMSPDLPSGLSFNTATGVITGTPTVSVSGNYNVTLVNGCGTIIKIVYISVSYGVSFYADTDGDGSGSGAATISCTGQPDGTSTDNTDCAPNDATKWRSANFYTDSDNDGYNNGFPTTALCYGTIKPAGYNLVNIGTDCNDTNPLVNPNREEIAGNGIDDNCDGSIDEVTTMSYLIAGSCGVTIPSLSSTLFAQAIAGAQGYRFQVTNGTQIGTYETNVNRFNLLNLTPGVTFSTTSINNSVKVSVKTGGFWRAYGSTCSVTSPLVPNSTSVSSPACGSYLTDISNTIFCYQIPAASGYRFRVRNGATLVGTYDSAVNRFNLVNIGIGNIVFPSTYTIDVLLQFSGVWLSDAEYGITCQITTPPTPATSKIVTPSCGSSINSIWSSIFALQVIGAQGYKFVFDNGVRSREAFSATSGFNLHNVPGGLMIGTTYAIRVDVLYNNSYVQGLETCTLTILPTATRHNSNPLDIFEIKSYPNPFETSFKLDVNTSSEEPVEVKIYDMLGRIIETQQLSVTEIPDFEFGNHYPSGVYSIFVTQTDNIKTLRMIKR